MICEKRIVADNQETIANELKYFSGDADVDVILTTGGTGLGPRDVTPEATKSVCERIIGDNFSRLAPCGGNDARWRTLVLAFSVFQFSIFDL